MSAFFGGTYRQAAQWDDLFFQGEKMPGVARVSGDGIKRKIDLKRAKGKAGASVTDEGDEPGRGTIELELWTAEQWQEMLRRLPEVNPRTRGGVKNVVDVSHPLLDFLGISRVYITDIRIPSHDKRAGRLRVQFGFLEWFPKPKPQRPTGVTGQGNSIQQIPRRQARFVAQDAATVFTSQEEADQLVEDQVASIVRETGLLEFV